MKLKNCFPIIKVFFRGELFFWLIPVHNRPVGGVVFFPGLSRFLFMVKKHLPSSKLGSPICYFQPSPSLPLPPHSDTPTSHPSPTPYQTTDLKNKFNDFQIVQSLFNQNPPSSSSNPFSLDSTVYEPTTLSWVLLNVFTIFSANVFW